MDSLGIDYVHSLITLLQGELNFHDQSGNYATHNFHSFPAKFPPQLPRLFIEGLTQEGEVLLDPMAGSGTSLVEGCLLHRQVIGFDIDPLALKIIQVKTTPVDPFEINRLTLKIIQRAAQTVDDSREKLEAIITSRFDENTRKFLDRWFLPTTQIELQALIQEIDEVHDPAMRNFFEVAFSAIIITKSGGVSLALDLGHTRPHVAKRVIDKSGNLLVGDPNESIPSYSTKIVRSVFPEFKKKCLQNLEGVISKIDADCPVAIQFGDAQSLQLPDESIDLIVTSPPYASNAIDYMRAHKFSLVWLGYPVDELGKRRQSYIGGESTIKFTFENLPHYTEDIIQKVATLDESKAKTLKRYYSEMTRVIKEMYRVLRPGKAAIVVVGNSMLRGIDAEIPECLKEIGISLGFQVPAIGERDLNRDKRMMPAGKQVNLESQIQQRMHKEYVLGFYKPLMRS